jgi:protein-L-isoaspartate O-methyltransferase
MNPNPHLSVFGRLWSAFAIISAVLLITLGGSVGAAREPIPLPQRTLASSLEHSAPYVPTPQEIVDKMLDLAKVVPDDVVYDMGSGDGRIVITAAQKYGAHAVGVELDPKLYEESRNRIAELGLADRAQIIHEDMFMVNVRKATVVTLYLLTSVNAMLRPMLEKQLRSGTRVVSHDFQVPSWDADQVVQVMSKNGVASKLYLYVRP